jgi:hypothetical protein
MPQCFLLVLIAVLPVVVAGCGKTEESESAEVIIHAPDPMIEDLPIYAQPGGLGGAVGWVNVGARAVILDRREVGPDVTGAIPGAWVKIRTVLEPHEGWILLKNTRSAPRIDRGGEQ